MVFDGTPGDISAEEMVHHHHQQELQQLADYREEDLKKRSVKDEL